MEVDGQTPEITVEILGEDGKKPAPKGILPGAVLKLKTVPSQGTGTYSWKSKSKAIKIENAGSQVVSLSVVAGQREAQSGEVIELVYTPSGRSALSPVTHTVSVIKVLIMKNDGHAYGYDEYEEIASKDHNWKQFQFKPGDPSVCECKVKDQARIR